MAGARLCVCQSGLVSPPPFIFYTAGQSSWCSPKGTSDRATNRLGGWRPGFLTGSLEDQRGRERWATQSKEPGEAKFSSGLACKPHHGPVAGDNVTGIKADGTGKACFLRADARTTKVTVRHWNSIVSMSCLAMWYQTGVNVHFSLAVLMLLLSVDITLIVSLMFPQIIQSQ